MFLLFLATAVLGTNLLDAWPNPKPGTPPQAAGQGDIEAIRSEVVAAPVQLFASRTPDQGEVDSQDVTVVGSSRVAKLSKIGALSFSVDKKVLARDVISAFLILMAAHPDYAKLVCTKPGEVAKVIANLVGDTSTKVVNSLTVYFTDVATVFMNPKTTWKNHKFEIGVVGVAAAIMCEELVRRNTNFFPRVGSGLSSAATSVKDGVVSAAGSVGRAARRAGTRVRRAPGNVWNSVSARFVSGTGNEEGGGDDNLGTEPGSDVDGGEQTVVDSH